MIVKQTCDRCFEKTDSTIMSMFNNDIICMDCKAKEKKHHAYNNAAETERQAVLNGNYNFKGVGKPSDL